MNWLFDIFARARQQVREWPEWMQRPEVRQTPQMEEATMYENIFEELLGDRQTAEDLKSALTLIRQLPPEKLARAFEATKDQPRLRALVGYDPLNVKANTVATTIRATQVFNELLNGGIGKKF